MCNPHHRKLNDSFGIISVSRAEDETKALFQQRDELSNTVKTLQGEKRALGLELDYLNVEKGRFEAALRTGKDLLQEMLT